MRLLSLVVLCSFVGSAAAQTVAFRGDTRLKTVPYTIKLINPWRPSQKSGDKLRNALDGDLINPKGATIRILTYIKAPAALSKLDPRMKKLIAKKQIKSKSGVENGYDYKAYWVAGNISTVTLVMRKGQSLIHVSSTLTYKATAKEISDIIKIGLSTRIKK